MGISFPEDREIGRFIHDPDARALMGRPACSTTSARAVRMLLIAVLFVPAIGLIVSFL